MLEKALKLLEKGQRLCKDYLGNQALSNKIEKYQEDCITILLSNSNPVEEKSETSARLPKTPKKYSIQAMRQQSVEKVAKKNFSSIAGMKPISRSSYAIKSKPTTPTVRDSPFERDNLINTDRPEKSKPPVIVYMPIKSPKMTPRGSTVVNKSDERSVEANLRSVISENKSLRSSRSKNSNHFQIKTGFEKRHPTPTHRESELHLSQTSYKKKNSSENLGKDVVIHPRSSRIEQADIRRKLSGNPVSAEESGLHTSRKQQLLLDSLRMQREIEILRSAKEAQDESIKKLIATVQDLIRPTVNSKI